MKLKCLSLSDVEQVGLWRNEQMEILRTPFPLTKEMQADFYKDVICNRNSNSRFWGIWIETELIGMCGLENIQLENRLAEISLLLNPEYHLDEYGEKILKLLLHEGFMNMNLENIYTEVYYCSRYIDFWGKIAIDFNLTSTILQSRKFFSGS